MLTINTNLSSLIAQGSMKQSTNKLNQAIERMTTGFKINHAKDNAANYSISTNMTTKIGAYNVAEDNAAMGLDLISTAEGTLSQIEDKLQRLRALAEQAANGTYGEQSLNAINAEANALVDEINRLYSTAEYNGLKLFGSEEASQAAPIAMFAMNRSATSEGGFISDPITYTDEEVAAMTTMTQAVAAGSLVSGGTYSISTVDELVALADYVNSGNVTTGMTFVLGADIDLSSIDNWTPISNYSSNSGARFKGAFDGNGHVIKNLTINNGTASSQGLFGWIASGSSIINVGLEEVSIKGNRYLGALVVCTMDESDISISNCYATGTVSGTDHIGGLVGDIDSGSSISDCYATVTVSGTERIGGLVGNGSMDSISNSYATGDVTGTGQYVGGLVGYLYSGSSISNSYATGTVNGTNYVGGLVGDNYGSISNCHATSTVNGTECVGGLVGCSRTSIRNCYTAGSVNGTKYIGGLLGYGYENASITDCHSTATVSGENYIGGLVGNTTGLISKCYSTGTVSGTDYIGGLAGHARNSVSECYAAGNVTGIKTVGGLIGSCNSSSGKSSVNNCYATGTVNGESTVGGLVGIADNNSRISNSYAAGDVTATGDRVGGLAGQAYCSISDSYATGNVSGAQYIGGLVGYTQSGLSISSCYATGSVSGTRYVNGLAKMSSGVSISNSAAVQTDSNATVMTEEEIKSTYTPDSMGFTEANGWTIVNDTPLLSWQSEAQNVPTPDPEPPVGGGTDPDPDTPESGGSGSGGGTGGTGGTTPNNPSFTPPNYAPDTIILQIGAAANWASQVGVSTKFSLLGVDDLRMIGLDLTTDYLTQIDDMLALVSEKQTHFGATFNRLESVLEEITIQRDNLVSSRSTIRDADIAEVSSHYIQQQILQQASATLLATANQSPSIALQLI